MDRASRISIAILLLLSLALSGCVSEEPAGGGVYDTLPLSRYTLDFDANAGGALPADQWVSVSFPSDNVYAVAVDYFDGNSHSNWVEYDFSAVDYRGADLRIRINTTDLPVGDYIDYATVYTTDIDGYIIDSSDLSVRLSVHDTLQTSTTRLEFNAAEGAVSLAAQDIELTRHINGGTWSARVEHSWLRLNATRGSAPFTLRVTALPEGLTQGSYTSVIHLRDESEGINHDIPVTLNVEPHKLVVQDNGIALSALPSRSTLSHSLVVRDNGGAQASWTASSDQSWLSVSPSNGLTGDTLTLSANPNALATDSIHYATVTLSSSDWDISNSETLRVGFYIRATDVSASISLSGLAKPDKTVGLVSDPIRPYVYETHADESVEVFNVHDASLVGTFYAPPGSELRELEISSDGSLLYALDRAHDRIIPIDLDTQTLGTPWNGLALPSCSTAPGSCYVDLRYARPNGHAVLITGAQQVLDAQTGARLASFTDSASYTRPPMLAVTPDGHAFFAKIANTTHSDLVRYALRYSDVNPTPVAALETHRHSSALNEYSMDLRVSADGAHVYSAAYTGAAVEPYRLLMHATNDLQHEGFIDSNSAALVALALNPKGKLYLGNNALNTLNVDVYDKHGYYQGSHNLPGRLLGRQLSLSGDGLRMITRSADTQSNSALLNFQHTNP